MKVKFISSTENPPVGEEHARFTIGEHEDIQKKFAKFKARGGPARPMRGRCHIIACWVGKDGVTCHYHCVDSEGNPMHKPTKKPAKRPVKKPNRPTKKRPPKKG